MKKTIISLALSSLFVFGAHATVIEFDEAAAGVAGGGLISIDGIDFSTETATVTQTDDGDGFLTGPDTFYELGGTIAVDWELGTNQVTPTGLNTDYEIWIDYSLTGTASGTPSTLAGSDVRIGVDFDPTMSMGTLFVDTTVDGAFTAGSATLGTFDMGAGTCVVFADIGADSKISVDLGVCDIDFNFMATAGYLSYNGTDLATIVEPTKFNFDVTVEKFTGLYFDYAAQEAAVADGDITVQSFGIEHDGNLSFIVPEPSSVAILGAGLILLGAGRRRLSK